MRTQVDTTQRKTKANNQQKSAHPDAGSLFLEDGTYYLRMLSTTQK
jgi:hypothetical protein